MKVHLKHGKVTQIMHEASRNYRYVCDVSLSWRVSSRGGNIGEGGSQRWTRGSRWAPGATRGGAAPPGRLVGPPWPPFGCLEASVSLIFYIFPGILGTLSKGKLEIQK